MLFDMKNSSDLYLFGPEMDSFKITSFLVDDIDNDGNNDLIIGIDITVDD